MKYQPYTSPRTLGVKDPIRHYPEIRVLMDWYLCTRKYPYPSEVIAAIMAEERDETYGHFLCTVDPTHWHIGRGGNHTTYRQKIVQAKRVFRKSVRDEIWREHVVRQEEETSGTR